MSINIYIYPGMYVYVNISMEIKHVYKYLSCYVNDFHLIYFYKKCVYLSFRGANLLCDFYFLRAFLSGGWRLSAFIFR